MHNMYLLIAIIMVMEQVLASNLVIILIESCIICKCENLL